MEIIYEDNHIIAVNKACGEIVQSDKSGDVTLIDKVKEYVRVKYNKPGEAWLGSPHRLDRPTSGVVLFARTSKALTRLNEMFKEKNSIKKTYWAIVDKKPAIESATLHHWIVRNEQQNKSFAYEKEIPNSKEASLSYKVIGNSDNYFLLEIELHTGRHHQIRAQLGAIGCKIKGDLKYGAPRSNPGGGIHLHARKIEFTHPVSKEKITITAPVPNDLLWKYFESKGD